MHERMKSRHWTDRKWDEFQDFYYGKYFAILTCLAD